MSREIDEGWVAEAIARHRRIEARRAEFDKAVQDVAVTVRSADGTVEVVVSAAGEVRDVTIRGSLAGRTNADLSHAVRSAVVAAADAARWAREKLHVETFGEFPPLAGS
ncbi:MAG TPA: YbaB/EbfC family nucleoid-associated protein [Pilimelia sp.]|nr:YbaB/EbfC family nucleoid-associated protein [Pilimelia sp.]